MTRLVTPPLDPTRHVTRTFASSSCSHSPATRGMLDGMRLVLIGVVVCVVSVGSATVARAQRDVRVTTLTCEDRVLVSLELLGAYTEELRDGVSSGLETTLIFDIELRQAVAFWLDRTVDRVPLSESVRYDGVINRYRVTRIADGHE
jgi:hypothetical protein